MQTNVLKLRELLINHRREIFEQLAHLESDRKALGQRVIEPIDEAQKEDLARLIQKLDERGKAEIKEINLALDRMATGTYGICELCGKSIPSKRLEVLPATRLCRKCAHNFEKDQKMRQHLRDEIVDVDMLDEYRNLEYEKGQKKISELIYEERISKISLF